VCCSVFGNVLRCVLQCATVYTYMYIYMYMYMYMCVVVGIIVCEGGMVELGVLQCVAVCVAVYCNV